MFLGRHIERDVSEGGASGKLKPSFSLRTEAFKVFEGSAWGEVGKFEERQDC